jgi:hypothetical protein
MALDKTPGGQVGRKYYLSKEKLKSKKEVQDGRHSMNYRALRVGLALQKLPQ